MNRLKKLSELKSGERAVVEGFMEDSVFSLRLQELGLVPGSPLEFVRKAPLGDPLEIKVRGFLLSMRLQDAELVTVRCL